MFNFPAINKTIPIDIDSWNTYNAQGQISQYDATFKWWQWAVDYIIQQAMPALNATTPTATVEKLTVGLADSICTTAQTYCTGANQQYANKGECLGYLTQKVRFGQAYELGMSPSRTNHLLSQTLSPTETYTDSRRVQKRPQHPPLPLRPPEHGPLPPLDPLPAHRQERRRILHR